MSCYNDSGKGISKKPHCGKSRKWWLPLHLICQYQALKKQQQIKIWYLKYGQIGIQLSYWVENIVGKKEKLLVQSNFSFSPAMFSKAVCCWCVKMTIYGIKGFTVMSSLFPPPPPFNIQGRNHLTQGLPFRLLVFLRVCSIKLLKTLWEKEKLLVTSNFSFTHSVFYLFREISAIFIKFKIVVCKLFQIGSVWNLVWERVKPNNWNWLLLLSFVWRASPFQHISFISWQAEHLSFSDFLPTLMHNITHI